MLIVPTTARVSGPLGSLRLLGPATLAVNKPYQVMLSTGWKHSMVVPLCHGEGSHHDATGLFEVGRGAWGSTWIDSGSSFSLFLQVTLEQELEHLNATWLSGVCILHGLYIRQEYHGGRGDDD